MSVPAVEPLYHMVHVTADARESRGDAPATPMENVPIGLPVQRGVRLFDQAVPYVPSAKSVESGAGDRVRVCRRLELGCS